jgi:hypothetical protein
MVWAPETVVATAGMMTRLPVARRGKASEEGLKPKEIIGMAIMIRISNAGGIEKESENLVEMT